MNKLLTTTAIALLLGIGSALAAEDYKAPDQSGAAPEASEDSSTLPSDPNAPAGAVEDQEQEPEAPQE